MPEPPSTDLLAYLRQYGRRYDVAVLREHLVSQGQDRTAVDLAVATYLAERQARGEDTGRTFLRTIGVVLLAMAALGVLFAGGCVSIIGLMSNDAQMNRWAVWLAVATVLVFSLLAAWTVAAIRRARRRAREDRGSEGT
jgi:hypothetical protein